MKQATYDSTKDFLSETAQGTAENPPVVGTVKGVIDGSGKVLEQTSKGIAKVRYTLDGKQCEFIVDDYKFDTKPTRQILEEIEKRLLSKS